MLGNRCLVIGCSGAGKSYFSRKLSEKTGLPLYHLDLVNWNKDKTYVEKSVLIDRINQVVAKDKWIIDGNYGSTLDIRLERADTVFFLDFPLEVCLEGVKLRQGKQRDDMPWIEEIGEIDEEFLAFIKGFNTSERPRILKLLEEYSHLAIHVFTSRAEVDEYLDSIALT